MMLQVLLDRLIGYHTGTPYTVSHCPKVLTPITLLQNGILLLKMMGGTAFQFLHQKAYALRGGILYMHVNMVFAHYSFQNLDILTVTDLDQQVTATTLNVACQYRVTVLRCPDQMAAQ